jgi:hypothetical protein
MATARCQSCGRRLTAAASIARGRGRACWAKVRRAATALDRSGFTAQQQAKAIELIEQGGLISTSRSALYVAVSSDGVTNYLVDWAEGSCLCPATKPCYHLLAAAVIEAAAARPAA